MSATLDLHEVAHRPVDERGRVVVAALNDTEMLREILTILRNMQDMVEDFDMNAVLSDAAERVPMLKMLMGG